MKNKKVKKQKTKQISNFKKVVFAKDDFRNVGNMLSNPTINISERQQSVLTPGTLWVPIFTDPETHEHYLTIVREVTSKPTKAKHKTPNKEDYNLQVSVKTIIESTTPIKIRKGAINPAIRYGGTKLDSKSVGVKGRAYKEFERFVTLAIRS